MHVTFDLYKLAEGRLNTLGVLGNNFSEVKIGWVSLFSFCPVLNKAFYDSLGETIENFPPL